MEQRITLAPGEGLPGFPSGHGPGDYLVDFEARTIRPVLTVTISGVDQDGNAVSEIVDVGTKETYSANSYSVLTAPEPTIETEEQGG